jgi:predicted nucleotidyltransferase
VSFRNGGGLKIFGLAQMVSRKRVSLDLEIPFLPAIEEDVMNDVVMATNFIVDYGLRISEIKLFGSLTKGTWDKRKSDIDLAVFLADDFKQYSCQKRIVHRYFYTFEEDGKHKWQVLGETPERRKFRSYLKYHPSLNLGKKYELHIVTPNDFEVFWKNEKSLNTQSFSDLAGFDNKPFLREMRNGLLLYKG